MFFSPVWQCVHLDWGKERVYSCICTFILHSLLLVFFSSTWCCLFLFILVLSFSLPLGVVFFSSSWCCLFLFLLVLSFSLPLGVVFFSWCCLFLFLLVLSFSLPLGVGDRLRIVWFYGDRRQSLSFVLSSISGRMSWSLFWTSASYEFTLCGFPLNYTSCSCQRRAVLFDYGTPLTHICLS